MSNAELKMLMEAYLENRHLRKEGLTTKVRTVVALEGAVAGEGTGTFWC